MANEPTSESYKDWIRQRQRDLQSSQPSLTLKKLASLIPIQYTYLSKVMNTDSAHFSEDHLFTICRHLKFSADEVELILLLRSYETASDSARRDYLIDKIEGIKKDKKLKVKEVRLDEQRLMEESRYLLDPLSILVHVALDIKDIRRDPRALCNKLGISVDRLKEILINLDKLGFIKLDNEDLFKVMEYNTTKFHFGKSHPLTRSHQNVLKTQMASQLTRLEESQKQSVLVTFTSDAEAFAKITDEFKDFLKRVEKIVEKSKDSQLFQLSFDLFKWL
jgi:uncharacterized protein (TIGR02147 family)